MGFPGLSIMAPCMLPTGSIEGVSQAVKYWYPLSFQNPGLFTAFIFSVLSHRRIRWLLKGQMGDLFRPGYQQWRELSYVKAVKLVNQRLQDSTHVVTDDLILNVLILSEVADDTGCLTERQWNKKSPFQPPLQSLQWLDVYGCKIANLAHIQGLMKLVNLKGGLENIKLPGLAPILSL
jgi:hypothetical protein